MFREIVERIQRAKVVKVMDKLGLTWHDVLVLLTLLETGWWVMYAFVDGADVLLRLSIESAEYHPFLIVQKCVSFVKLILTGICIWYGTIARGELLPLRIYLLGGVLVDATLIITWVLVSVEEEWPLTPSNMFGLHYVLTFVLFRAVVYYFMYRVMRAVFVSPFGTTQTVVVGTVNGSVVGIPEHGTRSAAASNLAFLGKGFAGFFQHYKVEVERSCVISVLWDLIWNMSIIISQELPELAFDVIFIGLFGSLPLYIPTENLCFRLVRAVAGVTGTYLVIRKTPEYIKYWVVGYSLLLVANTGFFCYTASTELADETTSAIFILCAVFFGSNAAKLAVCYCTLRFYLHLQSANVVLINDHNDEQ